MGEENIEEERIEVLPKHSAIESTYSLFVAWEQVLDVSVKASIQHAATKVTNRE